MPHVTSLQKARRGGRSEVFQVQSVLTRTYVRPIRGCVMHPSVMLRDVIDVTSGGARGRSGPAPDPNALRRDRAGDAAWTVLPVEGFSGVVPEFPLADALAVEVELWARLWRKPQAFMWSKLGLEFEVAAYVRAFLESVEAGASAGLKTAVLRMAAEIGLSTPGMHTLRWKFSEDELSVKRAAASAVSVRSGPSAAERWAAAVGDEG